MASTPSFTEALRASSVATASSGDVTSGFSAGASGSRVERVIVGKTAGTTAGYAQIYAHDGTTSFLVDQVAIPTATDFAGETSIISPQKPLLLPSGWSVYVSTDTGDTLDFTVIGSDY